MIKPETVSYVQGYRGDHDDEFVFEMIAEGEEDRAAAYFFVLSHAFDAPEPPTPVARCTSQECEHPSTSAPRRPSAGRESRRVTPRSR